MFQVLERYFSDLSVKGNSGHTPAVLAGDNGHFHLRDYIEEQEAMAIARVTTPLLYLTVYAQFIFKRRIRRRCSFFDMLARTNQDPLDVRMTENVSC